MTKENIIERVRKILELANNNANDNEAQVAMMKAQEMLAKHNMTMKDITKDLGTDDVLDTVMDITINASWKTSLAKVIAENFRCAFLISQRGRSRYPMFIGFEEDIEIAQMIFISTITYIDKRATQVYDSYYNAGKPSKGIRGDYIVGFIQGLDKQFQEQRTANKEGWGLVLVTPQAVTDKVSTMKTGTVRSAGTRRQGNMEAFSSGYDDGNSYNRSSLE